MTRTIQKIFPSNTPICSPLLKTMRCHRIIQRQHNWFKRKPMNKQYSNNPDDEDAHRWNGYGC